MPVVLKCSWVNRRVQLAPICASFPDFLLFIPLPQASEYPSPWQHSIRLVGGVITAGFPTEGLSHMDYLWTCMTAPDPVKYFLSKFSCLWKAAIQSRASSLQSVPRSREWRKSTTKVVAHPSLKLPCCCLQVSLPRDDHLMTCIINHVLYMSISEAGNLGLLTRITTFQLYHD